MPAASKNSASAKEKDRRKSAGRPSLLSTLKVSPDRLRKIISPASIKELSPVKESPATSTTLPTETAAAASTGDNASESNPGTPAGNSTPSAVPMGPPTEAPKKKGVKRSAPGTNGGEPKVRGKPGPKKKARLEDGTIDPNARTNGSTYHKLGPKANQGNINANLRALDRSGKPCRKWAKGGFRLKSFTGVLWEIPRWAAPPKPQPDTASQEPSASAESSNKENNKDGSQIKSENSNSAVDGEQRSVPPSVMAGSSPAPAEIPIAAAS
ncbi:INO80 complex, subunit Ies4 [Pseudomassariella vexata]|uniref:INO80 complex, subunit Ies4 n=1 Tax=Pseudomassariella vexata TaxID=1141098 RepID=A0A1Y2EB14_9PEZI|nr:INO80 complex, subunit Ies4 [Pseudomassariella vexata]ORY68751.1 INO80 complex, subunit Ies4 [Pseudomassariella vexata]